MKARKKSNAYTFDFLNLAPPVGLEPTTS